MYKKLPERELSRVKVFGERNTGTNFLNKLLSLNTNLQVLSHGNNSTSHANLQVIDQSAARLGNTEKLSPQIRQFVLERFIDEQRRLEYPDNYGWKHARVRMCDLDKSPYKDSTLFVFLVRNPWRFVSALHRRPYNLFPAPCSNLSAFVESQFLTNERDCMPNLLINNPVELWNEKVKSYLHCSDILENSLICYYEDLVTSLEEFIDAIRPVCTVSSNIRTPINSTKKDDKTFNDYKQEVLSYDPVSVLGEEVYLKILKKIDLSVLSQTIYASSRV